MNSLLLNNDVEKWVINSTKEKVSELLDELDNNYYNGLKQDLISDTIYDKLIEYAYIHKNIKHEKIGAEPIHSKINLPLAMASMDKIKLEHDNLIKYKQCEKSLEKFKHLNLNSNADNYIIQTKLDGTAGLLYYNNNELKMYTRGNGIIGQDITHLINYINYIPNVKGNFFVKGELILKTSIFKDNFKDASNARNTGTGIINSEPKEAINKLKICKMDFVAFELIKDDFLECPERQLNLLKKLGFKTVKHLKCNTKELNIDYMNNLFDNWIDIYEYDGLIIRSNIDYKNNNTIDNPKNAIAFKKDKSGIITKILKIEWNISKWGKWIPRIFIEPININGVIISKVSGKNPGIIKTKNIKPGMFIRVRRSGDVIPDFYVLPFDNINNNNMKENIYEDIELLNDNTRNFKWVSDCDIMPIIFDIKLISIIITKKLESLLKDLDVQNLAYEKCKLIVEKLLVIDKNVKLFKDVTNYWYNFLTIFVNISKNNILEILNIKEESKTSEFIYKGILKIKECNNIKFICASGFLGDNIKVQKINNIITCEKVKEDFKGNILDLLIYINNSKDALTYLTDIKNIGEITALQLINNSEEAIRGLSILNKKDDKIEDKNELIYNKSFYISGKNEGNNESKYSKKDVVEAIENMGGIIKKNSTPPKKGIEAYIYMYGKIPNKMLNIEGKVIEINEFIKEYKIKI